MKEKQRPVPADQQLRDDRFRADRIVSGHHRARTDVARRLFAEHGIEELQFVDEWDGRDVEHFRDVLTQEEFQRLCDALQDWEGNRIG